MIVDDLGRHLATCSFEGIDFPGTDVETSSGHDSARHKGYLLRGADIETTGPKEVGVTMRAVLKNGMRGWRGPALFPDQYARLLRALESTPEGLLTHPTRGLMVVHVDDIKESINTRERRGVELMLTFTEQRGESDLIDFAPTSTAPDAAMTAAATDADKLAPAGAASLLDDVEAALEYLDATPRSYPEATARVDALVRTAQARLADVATLGAEGHDYRVALRSLLGATLLYRLRYQTSGQRIAVLPAEMSLARAAGLIYGDPRRAADLVRANAIRDPSRIPAGTRLVVVG